MQRSQNHKKKGQPQREYVPHQPHRQGPAPHRLHRHQVRLTDWIAPFRLALGDGTRGDERSVGPASLSSSFCCLESDWVIEGWGVGHFGDRKILPETPLITREQTGGGLKRVGIVIRQEAGPAESRHLSQFRVARRTSPPWIMMMMKMLSLSIYIYRRGWGKGL